MGSTIQNENIVSSLTNENKDRSDKVAEVEDLNSKIPIEFGEDVKESEYHADDHVDNHVGFTKVSKRKNDSLKDSVSRNTESQSNQMQSVGFKRDVEYID